MRRAISTFESPAFVILSLTASAMARLSALAWTSLKIPSARNIESRLDPRCLLGRARADPLAPSGLGKFDVLDRGRLRLLDESMEQHHLLSINGEQHPRCSIRQSRPDLPDIPNEMGYPGPSDRPLVLNVRDVRSNCLATLL